MNYVFFGGPDGPLWRRVAMLWDNDRPIPPPVWKVPIVIRPPLKSFDETPVAFNAATVVHSYRFVPTPGAPDPTDGHYEREIP